MTLLYFNKTEADIWCREKLDAVAKEDERFVSRYILSDSGSDQWRGETGRMSSEIAESLHSKASSSHSAYCFVCGPNGFVDLSEKELSAKGYDADNLHFFRG